MPRGIYPRKKKPITVAAHRRSAAKRLAAPTRELPHTVQPYVVYVNYPNNSKEYSYLCTIPGIVQGDTVIANGCRVQVIRTASHDPRAVKHVFPVPDHDAFKQRQRKEAIMRRLREISREIREQDFFRDLAARSPEARRLWAELKEIHTNLGELR